MTDDYLIEMYRQLRTRQEKYVYFMLAASASAIAYALNRAQDRSLSFIHIPWGVALFLWGISFYFNYMHLEYVNSTLFANVEFVRIQKETHPEVGTNPQVIEAATD